MRPRDESGVKHKKKKLGAHRFHTIAVTNTINIFLPDTFEFP